MREIAPAAPYEVTQSHGYERSQPARLQGAGLQQIRVAIPERAGSVLIEYRRIGGWGRPAGWENLMRKSTL